MAQNKTFTQTFKFQNVVDSNDFEFDETYLFYVDEELVDDFLEDDITIITKGTYCIGRIQYNEEDNIYCFVQNDLESGWSGFFLKESDLKHLYYTEITQKIYNKNNN